METADKHRWGRTILTVLSILGLGIGIVAAANGYIVQIGSNTERIVKIDEKAEANEDDIHELEKREIQSTALNKSINDALGRIETTVDKVEESQQTSKEHIAGMQMQLKNLERAE